MISEDEMQRMLRNFEAGIHRHGWDQPDELYVMLRHPHRSNLSFMPTNMAQLGGGLRDKLKFLLGTFMNDRDLSANWAKPLGESYVGLMTTSEFWGATAEKEKDGTFVRPEGKLADLPGSVEIRGVFAADIWGRLIALHRVRGEKPDFMLEAKGVVPTLLTALVGQFGQHLPHVEPRPLTDSLDRLFSDMKRNNDL